MAELDGSGVIVREGVVGGPAGVVWVGWCAERGWGLLGWGEGSTFISLVGGGEGHSGWCLGGRDVVKG